MPVFQASQIYISQGLSGVNFQEIKRVRNININYSVPGAKVYTEGRFNPLQNQPVINYTPVAIQIEHYRSYNELETNLGLVNPTGIGTVFAAADTNQIFGYGARNFQMLIAPTNSANYAGQLNLYTGVLTQYSVQANVGEAAVTSITCEGYDMQIVPNNNVRNVPNYNTEIVIPENVSISGIAFSGFGITGINLQSFDLGIAFGRQQVFTLGNKFPTSRPITSINATMRLQGFLEGLAGNFTGLAVYDCGAPYTGSIYITLMPSCSANPGTTYIISNPFIRNFQLGAQIGQFNSVEFGLDLPISIQPTLETGSNLIIC